MIRRVSVSVFASLSLLALLLLGFCGYAFGVSRLQEEHSQSTMYKDFAKQLGDAVAPVSRPAAGVPVAILDIPAIGLHQAIVVEGSTGTDLARGPGHLPNSVLPGQDGVTVLLGRRGLFGAPFGHLPSLHLGDRIKVTTGQGTFSYVVNAYGDSAHPIHDEARARMLLVTANSTWVPHGSIYVGARLDGQPVRTPSVTRAATPADRPLASDTGALLPLQMWSLALLIASVLFGIGTQLWNRWATYLCLAPVIGALAWCVYESGAMFLPNVY